jgi:hypothetical protein
MIYYISLYYGCVSDFGFVMFVYLVLCIFSYRQKIIQERWIYIISKSKSGCKM